MLIEFSMFPTDKGESVSEYVARSIDMIDKSGLPYRLTPMGTIIEGEWDELMTVVKECHERIKKDCNRISCSIKTDYRKGKTDQLEQKILAIEPRLGKKLA